MDYVTEYFLGLLTGFCVGAIYETSSAWLTVLVATLVAGSIFIVVEAVWAEGGVRYASLFLRDLFVEGWPFVIIHYGIVFVMAWAYLGALHWLS